MLLLFGMTVACYMSESQTPQVDTCNGIDNAQEKESCIEKQCSSISDAQQKDECYRKNIRELTSNEMTLVIAVAKKMQDSMIQGAAVSAWVKDNNNTINPQQGRQLCELLQGRDKFYCMRRLSSPHLKR